MLTRTSPQSIACLVYLAIAACNPSDAQEFQSTQPTSDAQPDASPEAETSTSLDAPTTDTSSSEADSSVPLESALVMSDIEVRDLLIHDETLYVASESGLYAIAIDGSGEPILLDSGAFGQLKANSTHLFYRSAPRSINVHRINLSTKASYYDVYSGATSINAFEVDEKFAYLALDSMKQIVAVSGGTFQSYLAKEGSFSLLRHGQDLYFGVDHLKRVPCTGGNVETVVTLGSIVYDLDHIGDHLVISTGDGLRLYDTSTATLSVLTTKTRVLSGTVFETHGDMVYYVEPDNRIYRHQIGGASELVYEHQGPGWISAIEVSANYIYFASLMSMKEGTPELVRLPLP